jgi:hypothetical protein
MVVNPVDTEIFGEYNKVKILKRKNQDNAFLAMTTTLCLARKCFSGI